ncbi:MAG: hypothetical protein A2147_08745 [Chloroflexi bacterium RBG_16_57_8]|nr:MAG: hypothetical protein A2147_08745 [Chloroflexi bacterium RBG_16_57_8]
MAKYWFFAFSDCKDPVRAREYNDWYSNTHVPDMLQVPGMIRATRWEAAEPKKGMKRQYLAPYEFETDNIDEFNKEVAKQGKWTMEQGRFSDLPVFDPDNIPRIYRQIMPAKKRKRK